MAHAAPWSQGYVEWDGPLPKPRQPAIPVLKIFPGQVYDLRILSHHGHAVLTHHDGDRPLPCTDKSGATCWFNHQAAVKKLFRPQLWLHVLNRKVKEQNILCVTEGAVLGEPRLRNKAVDLRGAHLVVKRLGTGMRGKMIATLNLEPELCNDRLNAPANLEELLNAMWGAPLKDVEEELAQREKQAKRAKITDPISPVPGSEGEAAPEVSPRVVIDQMRRARKEGRL